MAKIPEAGIAIASVLLIMLLAAQGCVRHAAGNQTALGPGDYAFTIDHDGLERVYKVHVPPGYKSAEPAALIINMHGGGGEADGQIATTMMNDQSDREGFMVAYPQGTGKTVLGKFFGAWNAGRCCGSALDSNVDDVGFISAMIDEIEGKFSINPKMVYATGYSNGAQMSYRLACELSDKIAAIAPVASAGTFDNCSPQRAVPVIHFEGTEDVCSFYEGGKCGACFAELFNRLGVPLETREYDCSPVQEYIDEWRKRDGCANESEVSYRNGNATCISYSQCANGSEVVLCTVQGMGHSWPGGTAGVPACASNPEGYVCKACMDIIGPLSDDINANEEMWGFFKRHPMD